ncbi:hypothetical protein ABPG77_004972 [Micractinium sp. CCAP 211/92]
MQTIYLDAAGYSAMFAPPAFPDVPPPPVPCGTIPEPSGAPISVTESADSVSSVYNFTYTLTYKQSAQLDVIFKANGSLAASYSLGVFTSGNDTTQTYEFGSACPGGQATLTVSYECYQLGTVDGSIYGLGGIPDDDAASLKCANTMKVSTVRLCDSYYQCSPPPSPPPPPRPPPTPCGQIAKADNVTYSFTNGFNVTLTYTVAWQQGVSRASLLAGGYAIATASLGTYSGGDTTQTFANGDTCLTPGQHAGAIVTYACNASRTDDAIVSISPALTDATNIITPDCSTNLTVETWRVW